MSKENSGLADWARKGYIMVDGKLTKSESLVNKGKVEKIEPCSVADIKQMANATGNQWGTPNPDFNFKEQPKPNAKVRNATKTVVNGIKFDSKLEKYLYDLLKASQIDFEFQKVYILQEKFRYRSEAVRAITLTCDFFIPSKNMIIDTKGIQTQQGAIRWKLLKKKLLSEISEMQMLTYQPINLSSVPKIELPSTKAECDVLLNRLLYEL